MHPHPFSRHADPFPREYHGPGKLPGLRQSSYPLPRTRRGDERILLPSFDGHGFLKVSICGALVVAALLWSQTARADEVLLRGPRQPVRTTAQSAETAAEKSGILETIAAAPIHFYQRFLGPQWGRQCAYYPSCSNYALLAIKKHGALIGSFMTFDRLQHEANEAGYSPRIQIGSELRIYDPLENNDYWWYRAPQREPAAPADAARK